MQLGLFVFRVPFFQRLKSGKCGFWLRTTASYVIVLQLPRTQPCIVERDFSLQDRYLGAGACFLGQLTKLSTKRQTPIRAKNRSATAPLGCI